MMLQLFLLNTLRILFDLTTRCLDNIFFPAFRHVPIDRPIFVLGNPRSGTTFIHRFLLETDRLAAFALWEMLFPAITARRLMHRLVDRLAPLSPARYHSAAAHETSLRDVEADDLLPFFRFLSGGFFWSYFSAWKDSWGSPTSRRVFCLDGPDPPEEARLFRFMEACWRRNLYIKKKRRLIAKASTFTCRTQTLLHRYPDCKIIYMARDPVETIPSGMSLVTGVLEKATGRMSKASPQERERYLENLYQASCHLFRSFYEAWRSGSIPERNLRIIPYPRLMNSLEETIEELVDFLEIDPVPSFFDKVKEQAQKQRAHRSEHRYSPEQFGLTAERIRKDLAFVYDAYGLG